MAARKSRAATPARPRPARESARVAAPRAPTAAELPVTRAMLGAVRTELLERIDQAKSELRAEIQQVRAEVHELRAEVHELRAEVQSMKADIHGMRADIARMTLLFEEQNARNKVVLDALMAVIDRQARVEQRMDQVEETVRGLAAAHAAR